MKLFFLALITTGLLLGSDLFDTVAQNLEPIKHNEVLKGKLVLPGNRRVEGIALVLTPLAKQALKPIEEIVLEINNKKLIPQVAVIPRDQIIRICHGSQSESGANHNIYSPGPLFPFDMGILKKGDTTGKTIQHIKPGILHIYCSMYQSVEGHYLIVEKHQRGVDIASDGRFRMEGLPPGKYELAVWQQEKRFHDSVTLIELPLKNRLQIDLFRSVPKP